MASAIDWTTAEAVARRFAGRDAFSSSYHYASVREDFVELTQSAQDLVEAHTGWESESGRARARVVDRGEWIRANIASFRRMLRPLTDRLDARVAPGPLGAIGAKVAGAELGSLLGWMSSRVLGQYDLLVLEDDELDDQDIVYFVGPNILNLEKKYGFAPREFRLWVALHEVTHRTQFTAKPWIRDYFLEQVQTMLTVADPDPMRFFGAVGRAAQAVTERRNPLDDGGVVALFATPEQRSSMERVGGLMSLLEGHGDVTMDRAGGDLVPSAERFSRVLSQRRSSRSGPAKVVQKLIGLDAKLAQYSQGEDFIEAVEAAGGPDLLERAFSSREWLPTQTEIRDPQLWVERATVPDPARR